jgi:demethoxyubiquinone hydroxylase (CLK1/Coq7/Cat5 family)
MVSSGSIEFNDAGELTANELYLGLHLIISWAS